MTTEVRERVEHDRLEAIVREHAPALLAFFARRVDPAEDAADLLSETLLIAWRKAKTIPADDAAVRPWLFGVARNVLLHHRRGWARRQALADRLRDELVATPDPGFTDSPMGDELREALRRLPKIDRELIALIHWDGLSLVEVSRVLQMNESTARSRYRRARQRLRDGLAG